MYAFISREYTAIVYSKSKVNFLYDMYSYAKAAKVNTLEEAQRFFRENAQYSQNKSLLTKINYGNLRSLAHIDVDYYIGNNFACYNLHTSKFGYIRFTNIPSNVKIQHGYDLIKIKRYNTSLKEDSITSNLICISWILKFIGPFINLNIKVPSECLLLALNLYTGKSNIIQRVRKELLSRYGETYFLYDGEK